MIFFLHCDTIVMSSPPSNSYGAPAYRDMVVENYFGVGGKISFCIFCDLSQTFCMPQEIWTHYIVNVQIGINHCKL